MQENVGNKYHDKNISIIASNIILRSITFRMECIEFYVEATSILHACSLLKSPLIYLTISTV